MATTPPDSKLNLQIYQEASEWLIALRTSAADAITRERLDAWLRKSPEHVRAYLEVTAIWEDVALHDPQHLVSAETHVARAKAEDSLVILEAGDVQRAARSREARTKIPLGRRARPVLPAIAASFLLAMAAIALRFYVERGTYSTGIGEERSISLADGSVIDLNARSRVRVRLLKHERDVDLLQGEALFDVTHDSRRPFIVRSGNAVIRDLGTEFDVFRQESRTTVTVIAGRVVVGSPRTVQPLPDPQSDEAHPSGAPPDAAGSGGPPAEAVRVSPATRSAVRSQQAAADMGQVLLAAGQQVTVLPAMIGRPIRVNVAAATSWRQRRLIFDSAPLSEVVDEFNRYNERPLVIDDPALKDFRVIGVFSSTDPSSLIRFLSAQPGITVIEDDREIRITRR